MDDVEFEALRFVEVGGLGLFKDAFPQQTRFFDINPRPQRDSDFRGLLDLRRALAKGDADLVICNPLDRSPWHPDLIGRMIFNRRLFSEGFSPLRPYGQQLLRFPLAMPLAVYDMADFPYIERGSLYLMDRAQLYFKRELPADEWQVLTKTATPRQPSLRFRRKVRYKSRLARLQPLPLGLRASSLPNLPADPPEKRMDVFFAGMREGLPVRERALAELETLRADGYRIDIAEGRMPQKEFYERCARAWLTLSPEGLGWDCFRHYEAAACWSVPVINQPRIRRHAPLLEGQHAFYFDVEFGALSQTVRHALSNKDRLREMAEQAHAHVMANHTPKAIARYIVQTVFDAGLIKSQAAMPRKS